MPKTAKSDSKKIVKKVIQPDSKLDVPTQPFHPDEEPMVASGPSSGSKGGIPRRREPQIEEETEVKPEHQRLKQNLKRRKNPHLK